MNEIKQSLGHTIIMDTDYKSALVQITEALKLEGFGVLTEIDVQATLKKKLDVDFRPYKILGACNPSLAYRALSADPEVGMLLPCNVTVAEESNGRILVSIINPEMMLSVIDNPAITAVACDAAERLERVAAALQN